MVLLLLPVTSFDVLSPTGASDNAFCMEYTLTEDDISNPPSRSSTPDIPVHRSSGAKLVFSTTKVRLIDFRFWEFLLPLFHPCTLG